jgi:hypothetical protein
LSAKKSYNRFFIIFQEEDRGYGTSSDRPPTGYVKVESRNEKSRVTAYVQNLKPFETAECLYKCYLISHQDNGDTVAYLGIMNIDDTGRGESSWESGVDNAFGSKVSIDKFNTAVIVAEREDSVNIVAPLAGYMLKDKFDWRSVIPAESKKQEAVKVEEKTVEIDAQAVIFEEYEKQVQELIEQPCEAPKRKEEEKCEEPEEEKCEEPEEKMCREPEEKNAENELPCEETPEGYRSNKEEAEPADAGAETAAPQEWEDYDHIRHKHKKEKEYEHKEHNYGYEYYGYKEYHKHDYKHMLKKMLEDILEDFEELAEHVDLDGCRVWKIDLGKYESDKHKVYTYPCYDLIYYPIICSPYLSYSNYISRHGHFLFGIRYEDGEFKKLIFGIPGANSIYDQPFQGATGFTKWIRPFGRDAMGYWIMSYDPMTGYVAGLDE